MPNAYSTNYALFATTEFFSAVWKLTRVMLAAGWRYQTSGNGQSSGCTNLAQSGTAATVSSVTGNIATLTGLSGLTAGCVGQYVTISNGATSGNNGTWLITSFASATSITIYNATASSSDTNNGSIHWLVLKNASTDLWAVGGAVNLSTVGGGGSGSGTGVNIAAASASTGQATITGVSGFSQPNSPGRYLSISGSASGNNGSFRIVAATTAGTSVTVYAPGLAAETTNASLTVTEQYGGGAASIGAFSTTTSGQSTLLTISGLSSLTTGSSSADIGRQLTLTGAVNQSNNGTFSIVSIISSSSCLIYNPNGVASDAGTIQWVEVDPRSQTYPSYLQGASGQGAWINLQGPTIMKIPIGANVPTGTFIRGENVTQSTTGAQGELLGVNPDSSGGTGYLVIAPRVVGTGIQAGSVATYGWNNSANTDTITGAFSGATVTTPASSTPIAYISEMVIWKDTATQGHIYHQRIDQNSATESATTSTTGRFSTMASTLSAVTPQVCPGGSNTTSPVTNGFSTSWVGAYVVIGTGGPTSVNTGEAVWTMLTPTSPGKAQLIAANAIEQQGVSADGTWFYLQSCNSTGYQCLSYQRLDNQEDGDLDPYVHQGHWSGALSGATTRAADTTGVGSTTDNMNAVQTWIFQSTTHGFKGFRRRGLSSETYNWFSSAILSGLDTTGFVLNVNAGNPDQVATAISTTYVREPLWLWLAPTTGQLAAGRMRKGTPRWLQLCQGVSVNSTFDTEQWIVLSSTAIQFVAGPYDGATTPSF